MANGICLLRSYFRLRPTNLFKLSEGLLDSGYVEEVLYLGRELIAFGSRQVEESDDEGETAQEDDSCMPVIVEALERSNLDSF